MTGATETAAAGEEVLHGRAAPAHVLRLGHTRVQLDTAQPMETAARLYRSAGYAEVEPFNDNPYAALWFAKDLSA